MSAVLPHKAGHAWLRQRMAAPRRPLAVIDGDFRAADKRTAYRPAAVLVPLVEREELGGLSVLLTRRTAHLRHHAGQISFPGGRVEQGDTGPTHTALRETQEELGLPPDRVEVLGHLDDYTTGTSFRITPVVGLVHQPFELVPDSFEVEEVFELPLAHLFDAGNLQRNSILHDGRLHDYYAIPYRQHYVWGATAAMLINLCRYLAEEQGEAA
jgi:8-oxo-dGTP pyrophosphatase MutT (NUDIX family)